MNKQTKNYMLSVLDAQHNYIAEYPNGTKQDLQNAYYQGMKNAAEILLDAYIGIQNGTHKIIPIEH